MPIPESPPAIVEPCSGTCVQAEDMRVFLQVLKDKQCLQRNPPTFQLDPITIVTDVEGRVYFSGDQPNPYTLKVQWCNYTVTGTGKLSVIVAKKEPPVWGFRFRPKFAGSFIFLDAFERPTAADAIDVGFLWDFLYYKQFNLNVATGFRSVGLSVGMDLTRNFGVFAGYAFSWWTLRSNPQAGVFFSF